MNPPRLLLAIDPGLRKGGAAVFADGVLARAFTWHDQGQGPADAAWRTAVGPAEVPRLGDLTIVVERMVKYADRAAPHATLDEINKAFARGMLPRGATVKYVKPATWKGNVPKSVTRRRIAGALTVAELLRMPPETEHDAWDAAGIGLVFLERLQRGCVTPRSTE